MIGEFSPWHLHAVKRTAVKTGLASRVCEVLAPGMISRSKAIPKPRVVRYINAPTAAVLLAFAVVSDQGGGGGWRVQEDFVFTL